jgi:hypothetical protein
MVPSEIDSLLQRISNTFALSDLEILNNLSLGSNNAQIILSLSWIPNFLIDIACNENSMPKDKELAMESFWHLLHSNPYSDLFYQPQELFKQLNIILKNPLSDELLTCTLGVILEFCANEPPNSEYEYLYLLTRDTILNFTQKKNTKILALQILGNFSFQNAPRQLYFLQKNTQFLLHQLILDGLKNNSLGALEFINLFKTSF